MIVHTPCSFAKGLPMPDGERALAIFIDFENLALGFHGRRDRFDIERVLERLVEKGKVVAKKAIGLGMQESTSNLLRDNCDEFIYYEDLGKTPTLAPNLSPQLPENKRKAFELLLESMLALRRENKEVLWSSMVKDTMKRKKPSFNEAYHGYRTFSELLEDAQKEGLLELDTDKRSRTYVVTRFGSEMNGPASPAVKKKPSRRRRSSGKRRAVGAVTKPPPASEMPDG